MWYHQQGITMSSKYIYSVILEGQTSYDILLPSAETDYIQRTIAEAGRPYEHDMLKDMASRLVPGDVVVDIGANIGNHTLFLAIVAKVKVLAIEPNTQLVAALEKSVEINRLQDSVSIVNCGLGSESGSAYFTEEIPENLGSQRLTTGLGDIPIKTLTEIQPDRPIRLIKVDVEGMELEVLKGAKEIIEEDKPFIYVECQDLENYSTIESYLNELGYLVGETFNATPTHLFVHETATSPFALRDVLHRKIEKAIYEQPAKLAQLSDRLHQANLKYREANQRIDTLKQRLELQHGEQGTQELKRFEEFEIAREENIVLSNKLAELNAELMSEKKISNQLQTKQLETESKLRGLELEHQKKSQLELEAITCQLQKVNTQLNEEKRHVIQINSKLTSAEKALNETEQRYQLEKETWKNREREYSDLKAATEGTLMETEKRFERLESDHKLTKKRLEDASAKYRKATGEVIPTLKHQLETLRVNLEQTSRELVDQKKRSVLVEQQIRELRASIMFRLGYTIVEGATSLNGVKNLPARLFRIGIDALNKIKESNKKDNNKRKLDRQVARVKKVSQKENKQKATILTELPEPIPSYKSLEEKLSVEQSDLKIACVMDEFTYASYSPTAHLKQLTPKNWKDELEDFMPELLFIESAWRGKDELWGSKVGHNAVELQGIIEWCKSKEIPTVFWNKEDPVHFQTFINTAKNFDFVFTTDIDCIGRYKSMLGHNNVFFLPFACQPLIHNPLKKYERKDSISFAGAYYVKYPERAKDLADFVRHLPSQKPLEIFDRNFGKTDPNYQFPDHYEPYIVGTLPHEKIDIAYKGYEYAINLNSIKQSQSMFARRVFELLASNTLTLSNFSKGVRLMFGDIVQSTDSGSELAKKIEGLIEQPTSIDKIKVMGLRKVFSEHTYAHRLNYIEGKVFGKEKCDTTNVAVIAFVDSSSQAKKIITDFKKQTWKHLSLTLVNITKDKLCIQDDTNINILSLKEVGQNAITDYLSDEKWLTCFSHQDYYGPNYISDLVLLDSFTDVDAIGKGDSYIYEKFGSIKHPEHSREYTLVDRLPVRASIVKTPDISFNKLMKKFDSNWKASDLNGGLLNADRFSYCKFGSEQKKAKEIVDFPEFDCGLSLEELQRSAEAIKPNGQECQQAALSKKKIAEIFYKSKSKNLKLIEQDDAIEIKSSLDDGKHDYVYASKPLNIEELYSKSDDAPKAIKLYFDTAPGLNLSLVLIYQDEFGQRIGHEIFPTNCNITPAIPCGCTRVLLGFRALSGGSAFVSKICLDHRRLQPDLIFTNSRVLTITNNYPSYEDLYKNAFVHTRVKAYKEHGERTDVFQFKSGMGIEYNEFQGVDVTIGGQEVLRELITYKQYDTYFVHFLTPEMWAEIKRISSNSKLVIWIHGADVQPWWRREFNYPTEDSKTRASVETQKKMAFWKSVFDTDTLDLHFVFVSKYFAQEVFEDYDLKLDENKYSVIHNPIDTSLFDYNKKDASQRKKILSIRPYASKVYANDLTVKAILLLKEKSFFSELEFLIVGDGPLFDETLAPIKDLKNVKIERRFLQQQQIAEMHKSYGIFLCPTRYDTHGVSRDEAMASGLVPLTNKVAAVPEFTCKETAFAVEPESAEQLAMAIEELFFDESLFQTMSESAANRVRKSTGKGIVLKKELSLAAK